MATVVAVAGSSLVGDSIRLGIWAAIVVAWVVGGLMLAAIALATTVLPDDEFPADMARRVAPTFRVAAAITLGLGAARPAPIVLVGAVASLLAVTSLRLFVLALALDGHLRPGTEHAG